MFFQSTLHAAFTLAGLTFDSVWSRVLLDFNVGVLLSSEMGILVYYVIF